MNIPYEPRVSRRSTLQWLATVAMVSSVPSYGWTGTQKVAVPPALKGYGSDPDLIRPKVPWGRTMTAHQLQLTGVLADLILPGRDSALAPSALGIPDFVDEWVSAPYPEQQKDRVTIFNGLEWIDAEAHRRWDGGYLQMEVSRQQQILGILITQSDDADATAQDSFFRRFRYVVVGAYYTTPEGLREIGYIGNVPLPEYPPTTNAERAILDAELQRLGI